MAKHPDAIAWEQFKEREPALFDDSPSGEYLSNRLWHAFMAGIAARFLAGIAARPAPDVDLEAVVNELLDHSMGGEGKSPREWFRAILRRHFGGQS